MPKFVINLPRPALRFGGGMTWCVLGALLAFAGSAPAAGLVDEPYTVYVCEDGSFTRCGPSTKHYRTDRLAQGDALEVYLESADGWLGIRPPESSFCWLPSDQADVQEGKAVGTITDADAVAWIGTNLGSARKYRWQVQFQKGEPITVLGQTERENAAGKKEIWYRIVPPAGEFRWVHESQVVASREQIAEYVRQRQAAQLAQQAVDDEPTEQPMHTRDSDAGASVLTNAPAPATPGQSAPQRQQSAPTTIQAGYEQPVRHSRLNLRDNVPVRTVTSSSVEPESSNNASESSGHREHQPSSSWTPSQSHRNDAPIHRPSSASLPAYRTQAEPGSENGDPLQALQLDTARLMARRGSASEAEAILADTERLLRTLTDPTARQRAETLIARIEKYQRLAKVRDDWSQETTDAAYSANLPNSSQAGNEAGTSAIEIIDSKGAMAERAARDESARESRAPVRDDQSNVSPNAKAADREDPRTHSHWGQGVLVKVYSARRNAPPYALTDADGKTVFYVVPDARQDISRMLNRRVHAQGALSRRTEDGVPVIDTARIRSIE